MTKYRLFLLVFFISTWIWSGINPPSYSYWLLENVPVFAAVLLFILLKDRIELSDLSYTLIVLYFITPLITFHYGVTSVPVGFYLGKLFATSRNLYDKVVHFAFGFFWFYPIQEFVRNINKGKSKWDYYIPLCTIVSGGAIYEIFEWVAAVTINPTLARQFYGMQGDIFDTQKDMAIALIGALTAMLVIVLLRKYKKLV